MGEENSLFVAECIRPYKQYLVLKKKNPSVFYVPCYDIQFVWWVCQTMSMS